MDDEPTRVLIIDGDADEAAVLSSLLGEDGGPGGYAVSRDERLGDACRRLEREDFDAVLLDLDPPPAPGPDAVRRLRAARPEAPVVVLARPQDEALAREAERQGAYDRVLKGGPDRDALARAVRRAAEKKRLSDAVRRLRAEARECRRALELKDHFMSRLTHDFRNTLSTLTAAVFCLQDARSGPMTEAQARLTEMIARNVERETKIAESLVDLSRFRPGRLKVRFRSLDLSPVLARVAQEFAFSGRPIKPQVSAAEGLPSVDGDPELIAQVLRHLIDNAQRHARRRIAVEAAREGPDAVCVGVSDDGDGIPARRMAGLFTELAPPERRAGGGRPSGLGLAVCREIVEGHGGRIWAESVPGAGARFRFVLPLRHAPPALVDDREPAAAAGG